MLTLAAVGAGVADTGRRTSSREKDRTAEGGRRVGKIERRWRMELGREKHRRYG